MKLHVPSHNRREESRAGGQLEYLAQAKRAIDYHAPPLEEIHLDHWEGT